MSILITGLDMPKDGEQLCININPDGKVCINLDLSCEKVGTAVPVPPHGRLIDADEFLNRAFGTGLFGEDDMRLIEELIGGSNIMIPADTPKEAAT